MGEVKVIYEIDHSEMVPMGNAPSIKAEFVAKHYIEGGKAKLAVELPSGGAAITSCDAADFEPMKRHMLRRLASDWVEACHG